MSTCLALSLQVLKRPEYFGRFGKIHKVVINNSTSYAGSQVKHLIKLSILKSYYHYYHHYYLQ